MVVKLDARLLQVIGIEFSSFIAAKGLQGDLVQITC